MVDYTYTSRFPSTRGILRYWDKNKRLLWAGYTLDGSARGTQCAGFINKRLDNPPMSATSEPRQIVVEAIVQCDGSEIHITFEPKPNWSKEELKAEVKDIDRGSLKGKMRVNIPDDDLVKWYDIFTDRKDLRDQVYAELAK